MSNRTVFCKMQTEAYIAFQCYQVLKYLVKSGLSQSLSPTNNSQFPNSGPCSRYSSDYASNSIISEKIKEYSSAFKM